MNDNSKNNNSEVALSFQKTNNATEDGLLTSDRKQAAAPQGQTPKAEEGSWAWSEQLHNASRLRNRTCSIASKWSTEQRKAEGEKSQVRSFLYYLFSIVFLIIENSSYCFANGILLGYCINGFEFSVYFWFWTKSVIFRITAELL